MAKRGRKPNSIIRDRLIELLSYLKEGYGYDIYRYYVKVWGKVTLRSIYYHLHKGVELEVFSIKKVEEVKGDYSWGLKAKRIIYALGPNATPKGDPKIKSKLKIK